MALPLNIQPASGPAIVCEITVIAMAAMPLQPMVYMHGTSTQYSRGTPAIRLGTNETVEMLRG